MKNNLLIVISLIFFTTANAQCPYSYSDKEYKDYFEKHLQTLDPIEGIWTVNYTEKSYYNGELKHITDKPNNSIVYIIKHDDHFIACSILNENDNADKKIAEYETKISFAKTAIDGLYMYVKNIDILALPLHCTHKANAILTSNTLLEYSYEDNYEEKKIYEWKHIHQKDENGIDVTTDAGIEEYIRNEEVINFFKDVKIFPNESTNSSNSNLPISGSGTGFAITSNGIIATNYHVINGAKSIKVKGIKGDFSKSYNAKVIISDMNNDLALIQIDDNNLNTLGTVPYIIKNTASKVGENVFALGYPLQSIMGDEIKLSNGIISSNSGYKGDITTYQISVPLQPGNSGGPLFDNNGNLVGIVNSKLSGGENVSYAIKSTYLINLIQNLNSNPVLPNNNQLKTKNLSDKVSMIKNYVYFIEVN